MGSSKFVMNGLSLGNVESKVAPRTQLRPTCVCVQDIWLGEQWEERQSVNSGEDLVSRLRFRNFKDKSQGVMFCLVFP